MRSRDERVERPGRESVARRVRFGSNQTCVSPPVGRRFLNFYSFPTFFFPALEPLSDVNNNSTRNATGVEGLHSLSRFEKEFLEVVREFFEFCAPSLVSPSVASYEPLQVVRVDSTRKGSGRNFGGGEFDEKAEIRLTSGRAQVSI